MLSLDGWKIKTVQINFSRAISVLVVNSMGKGTQHKYFLMNNGKGRLKKPPKYDCKSRCFWEGIKINSHLREKILEEVTFFTFSNHLDILSSLLIGQNHETTKHKPSSLCGVIGNHHTCSLCFTANHNRITSRHLHSCTTHKQVTAQKTG